MVKADRTHCVSTVANSDFGFVIRHSDFIQEGTSTNHLLVHTTQEFAMKLTIGFVGPLALAGAAVSSGAAWAMPIGLAANADIATNVEQVRLVSDRFGRCFRTPGDRYGGYGYGPRFGHGPGHGGWHRGWHRGHRW